MPAPAELGSRAARIAAERIASSAEKSAGVLGPGFPPEIASALGLDPILFGAVSDPAGALRAEEFVGADSCSLCRSLAGAAPGGESWLSRLRVLVLASACDQQRRAAEAFARRHSLPVVAFALPRTASDNAFRRYLEQLARAAAVLGEMAGGELRPESLAAATAAWRRLRARLRALRSGMRFSVFARLAADCFALGPERALDLLPDEDLPAREGPGARLFLVGSCLGTEDAVRFGEDVEALGADVVGDAVPGIAGLLDPAVPEGGDDLEGLARAFFALPGFGRRPNDDWFERVKRGASAVRAEGLVVRCQRFCDLLSAERLRLAAAVAPLPMVFLDEETGSDAPARRRTRLGALLEKLSCRGA
ncbi:MAG: 2-hydroxyacyl-CoA dehydratase family protein [Planctomycetota bacterium]